MERHGLQVATLRVPALQFATEVDQGQLRLAVRVPRVVAPGFLEELLIAAPVVQVRRR